MILLNPPYDCIQQDDIEPLDANRIIKVTWQSWESHLALSMRHSSSWLSLPVFLAVCAPRQGGIKEIVSIANFPHFFMATHFHNCPIN